MTVVLLEALTFGLGRLVEAAEEAGHRLCLLTGDRSVYAHELARLDPGRLAVVDVDTTDLPACEALLRGVPDLAGIVNSTDTWAVPGAELAARLGLPGPDPAAVRALRDKGAVRSLLHRYGLSRGPAVAVLSAPGQAERLAERIGFPLVIKDSAGTSSRGVWLVRDRAELDRALVEARRAPLRGHPIAEPFFAGPLYSAETVTWGGRTRLLGVSSRQLSPEPMRREEATAFPVALPAADLAELGTWVERVLDAAGHRRGFAHTEFVLTADGPEVVEINIRIGGALVGEALCRSLGVDAYRDVLAMALGRAPALLEAPLGGGPAVAFAPVYATRAGWLEGWGGLERLAGLPGDPEWYPTARPGDHLAHLGDQRGCTGFVLAGGPTAELALHRALAAAGGVAAMVTSTGSGAPAAPRSTLPAPPPAPSARRPPASRTGSAR